MKGIPGQLPRAVSFQILGANGGWVTPPADELRNGHVSSAENSTATNCLILPAPLSEPAALENVFDDNIPGLDQLDFDALAFLLPSPKGTPIPPAASFDLVASSSLITQMTFSPKLSELTSNGYPIFTAADGAPKTPTQLLDNLGFRQFEKRLLETIGMSPVRPYTALHT